MTAISRGISEQVPMLKEQTRWAGRASATCGVCSLGIERSRPGFHWQAQRGGQEGSRKSDCSRPRSSHCSLKLVSVQGSRSPTGTSGFGGSAGLYGAFAGRIKTLFWWRTRESVQLGDGHPPWAQLGEGLWLGFSPVFAVCTLDGHSQCPQMNLFTKQK